MSRASPSGVSRSNGIHALLALLVQQHHIGRVFEVQAGAVPGATAIAEVVRVRVRLVGGGRGRALGGWYGLGAAFARALCWKRS